MPAADHELEHALETETIALNRWLYAAGIGRDVDPAGYAAPAERLAGLYARWLEHADPARRYCAVENWAEARRLEHDLRLEAEMDERLVVPELATPDGPLAWRTWRAFESAAGQAELVEGFARLVERSAGLAPALEARWAALRADFGRHGLDPVTTFCWREGLTPADLRAQLTAAGTLGRAPFEAALARLSQQVFGRPAGPAELRALYLHRMYAPLAGLFPETVDWTADTLAAFAAAGYELAGLEVDLAPRPKKYAGAFCFPIAIPGDVRVSVRPASAHYLVDMLYHEFGHAVHFSGIAPELPFLDRYWIHAGTHETLATLFEYWLAEPLFLAEHFHLDDAQVQALLDFAGFKQALTATWQSAAALAVMDAWEAGLAWPDVEQRLVIWLEAFTGVRFPAGFARLHPYVNALSIYPAGYVLAEARVGRWLKRLRALGGERWWQAAPARADIRAGLRLGARLAAPEHSPWQ